MNKRGAARLIVCVCACVRVRVCVCDCAPSSCAQVKPAFGTEEEDLRRLYDLGIIPFSDDFTDAKSRLLTFARQARAFAAC